jgi:hypothetical protein
MRIRQLTAAGAVAAATLLLSACGGNPLDGKSGQEVADQAADALQKAGAVHAKGTVSQDGQDGKVDLQLQGDDASGTLTFSGVDVELISLGGTAYLQAPGDFWASFGVPADAASQLEGQWVVVPAEAASSFENFSLNGFIDELRKPSSDVKKKTKDDEVDGDPVVIVEQEDGSTLTVANDDNAYPLKIEDKGDAPSTINLSDFGKKKDISAPDNPLDLNDLGA